MASKAIIYKFDKTNKATIKGKTGHSRTGACTCKATEKCFHGPNDGRKSRRKHGN